MEKLLLKLKKMPKNKEFKKQGRMPFKEFKKLVKGLMDPETLLFHEDMVFAFKVLFIENYYPRLKTYQKEFFLNQYNQTRFGYISYYFGDLEKFLKKKGNPETINGFFMDLQNLGLHQDLDEKSQKELDEFSRKMLEYFDGIGKEIDESNIEIEVDYSIPTETIDKEWEKELIENPITDDDYPDFIGDKERKYFSRWFRIKKGKKS